jgi:hypothetical protein
MNGRMINSGPPVPPALRQGRSGERSWPGDATWRAQTPKPQKQSVRREPALLVKIDLRHGVVNRAWHLLLRFGGMEAAEVTVTVPERGPRRAEPDPARRRPVKRAADGQARSRRRGNTSSL